MQKNNKKNIFSRWATLANPHKGLFAGQIIFYSLYTILFTLITVFAARTINCIYNKDWSGAYLNLGIELSTIILRNVFYHIQYKFYCKQVAHIRYNVASKVYKKILSCKDKEFDDLSKEKVTNIVLNNMSYLSEFADSIAAFFAYSLEVIVILVAVFTANYIAGAIVAVLGIINFFVYFFLNRKLGRIMLERYEKKDDMFKSYSKIIEGKTVIKELNSKEKYSGELLDNVTGFNKAYTKYYMTYSYKENIYYATWNVVVYAITALMLFFVSKGSLEVSMYLIIIPYLTTCTEQLNVLFDKTGQLENMRVDVDRVNLILNMSDEELIKYGELNNGVMGYNLSLIDVSVSKKAGQPYYLKDVDLSFKTNAINVVKSAKLGGKRAIFDLLRRYEKPDDGKVLLDNLDLFDYDEKSFKNHINYCASHPTFINGTIKENFLLVSKNFEQIKDVCSKVGVLKEIEKLPEGFNTQVSEIKASTTKFLIGLVRALLTDCKILMIYEIPQDAPESFRKKIVKLLKTFNINKTIILFTHADDYDDLASLVYSVKNGKVKLTKAHK